MTIVVGYGPDEEHRAWRVPERRTSEPEECHSCNILLITCPSGRNLWGRNDALLACDAEGFTRYLAGTVGEPRDDDSYWGYEWADGSIGSDPCGSGGTRIGIPPR